MHATYTPDPKFYKDDIFDKLEDLFDRIDKWFRGFGHRREIAKIHAGLMKNPKLLIDTKDKFEKAFGVSTGTRSPKQWQNLVRVYGVAQVCKIEKMTPEEVSNKTTESFTKKVRSLR